MYFLTFGETFAFIMIFLNFLFAFGMPGGWEMVVIALVVLLLFGAKKIPELARGLGRGIREFKDATREVKEGIQDQDTEPQPPSKEAKPKETTPKR